MDSIKLRQMQLRAAFDAEWRAFMLGLHPDHRELAQKARETYYQFYLLGRQDELREFYRAAQRRHNFAVPQAP